MDEKARAEGSGGIWERLRYDWPILTTSSLRRPTPTCGEALPATPTPSCRHTNGTTDIDDVVVRDGKNLKGNGLGFVLSIIGEGLEKASVNSSKLLSERAGGSMSNSDVRVAPRPRASATCKVLS